MLYFIRVLTSSWPHGIIAALGSDGAHWLITFRLTLAPTIVVIIVTTSPFIE